MHHVLSVQAAIQRYQNEAGVLLQKSYVNPLTVVWGVIHIMLWSR